MNNMRNIKKHIFFGRGIYILLAEFLILAFLTAKYYFMNDLHVDDGKSFYNFILALLSLTGGILSLKRMMDWGGYKSTMGKILLLYGFGLFAWTAGTVIWAYYYVFLGNAIPYPSWGDLAYVLINPCFIVGIALFGHVIGLKKGSTKKREDLYFYLFPILMALVTFYFVYILGHQLELTTNSWLKVVLDFYYAFGDIVQLVVLMVVSGTAFNYLGIRLRLPFTMIVASLLVSYVADTLYAYSTSVGTYYNGGYIDFLYSLLLLLFGIGIHILHPRLLEDNAYETE